MNRNNPLYIFLFIITGTVFYSNPGFGQIGLVQVSQQEPLKEDQILYNGKEWHNNYTNVKGDQFLFSKDYLPGSIMDRF
jgi:hypothetical protein